MLTLPGITFSNFCFVFCFQVHVVEPQLAQAQPCLVCGNAVLRLWSFMSREGDRYLRITSANDNRNNNHKIVDCGGGLQRDNFTSKQLILLPQLLIWIKIKRDSMLAITAKKIFQLFWAWL